MLENGRRWRNEGRRLERLIEGGGCAPCWGVRFAFGEKLVL
jgi:hypothetical protein